MQIGKNKIAKGSVKSFALPAGETALGDVDVPCTVINGSQKGPTVAITAACHPMELNGVLASIRLAKEIDPAGLCGALLIVHVQNVMGFQFKTGHISPLDGVNMGQAFPVPDVQVEDSGGVSHQGRSLSYEIAACIDTEIISRSDYLIDLHGGELHESLMANIEILPIGDDTIDARTRAFAQSFGFDYIWEVPCGSIPEMQSYPARGSAVREAMQKGIPAVYCEVGSEGKLDEQLVDYTVNGVFNALRYLDMLPGDKTVPRSRILSGGHVLFAIRGGLFLAKCQSGDELKTGQIIGEIINLAGEVVDTITAPSNGVLTNIITLGVVNPGDMLFVIGDF